MANSGTILGNHVIVSGSAYAQLRIEWQLASQNVGANTSLINYQAYIDFFGCDAQLDNGHVNWNGGALYSNNGRVYNFASNFTNHTVTMATGSFTASHDGAGNFTLNMNGSIDVYQTGTSSGSGSWSLPTINRYSNITSFTASAITDEGFTLNMTCDLSASQIEFSLDNGSTWQSFGSGTSKSNAFHNLQSEKQYTCKCRTTNAASGLQQVSSAVAPTTLGQNNFFYKRVP